MSLSFYSKNVQNVVSTTTAYYQTQYWIWMRWKWHLFDICLLLIIIAFSCNACILTLQVIKLKVDKVEETAISVQYIYLSVCSGKGAHISFYQASVSNTIYECLYLRDMTRSNLTHYHETHIARLQLRVRLRDCVCVTI